MGGLHPSLGLEQRPKGAYRYRRYETRLARRQQRRRTTLRADDLTCAAAATTLHPHRCARPSSLFPCLRVYSIGAPLGV